MWKDRKVGRRELSERSADANCHSSDLINGRRSTCACVCLPPIAADAAADAACRFTPRSSSQRSQNRSSPLSTRDPPASRLDSTLEHVAARVSSRAEVTPATAAGCCRGCRMIAFLLPSGVPIQSSAAVVCQRAKPSPRTANSLELNARRSSCALHVRVRRTRTNLFCSSQRWHAIGCSGRFYS